MIYLALNLVLLLFYICETVYIEKTSSKDDESTNPIGANILLCAILCLFYFVLFMFRNSIATPLLSTLMKICFLLEGCLLINISFCFIYYAWGHLNNILFIIKLLLYVFVLYVVMFNFGTIRILDETGIVVNQTNLVYGKASETFFISWYTIYNVFLRYFLPGFCCLIMLAKNEQNASKLDKFKGYIYAIALVVMWAFLVFFYFIKKEIPLFSLIPYIVYLPIFIIFPFGYKLEAAPSGRVIFSFILKALTMFLIPSAVLGISIEVISNITANKAIIFIITFLIISIVLFFALAVMNIISKSKFGHSADYAVAFEQDLAKISYSGEMDKISERMFNIFKKHAESSSMSVYISVGQGTLETAYSSNNKRVKIQADDPIFEFLLNLGKNVVIYTEAESEYILSPVKDQLLDFFKKTESDALFVLNEGRDVHGLITLGIKESKDHYKEYDLQVFSKLYSYFFVFGYYMRNISNKEIIGTVNRELRMSSQIITSIQENMDPVKNPKLDAGCIMVPAHNIGGEFVDMIRLTAKRHLFVMGSVSGKGIAASMSMVILKAIIRAFLAETHDFKQLVCKINSFVRNNLQKGTLFSGMFAIVNFEDDTMYYINCGIPAMFLFTESYNNVIEIQGSGHILGFVEDISPYISVKQMKLHQNDVVFCCTNGLIASPSLRGEQFGKDRITRNFLANRMYPAHRMAQFANDALSKFMSHEMEADVTVLVLKYLEDGEIEEEEEAVQDGPGQITDGLDDGQSVDDIFANIEEM